MLKFYAPASIGNVSVGFDVLGAAVTPIDGSLLGDCVSIEPSNEFSLHNRGHFANKLPQKTEGNLVYLCWQRFSEKIGHPVKAKMVLEKNMPIGSGLGSSACSIVAALNALNAFCDHPLNSDELLLLMGEMEGIVSGSVHYDNVAPAYLGGLQLMLEENAIICQSVPSFDEWLWVMAYPGIKVSTAQARAILPEHYSKQDCIRHGRCLSGFIHACHSGQSALALALMHDVIAEPYRTQLLPGFAQARVGVKALGALACGISGSGPTLFAIADKQSDAHKIADWLKENYVQNGEGFVHICKIDTQGARQIG